MNKIPKNKKESDILIDALDLNRVEEIVVSFDDPVALNQIKQFIYRTNFQYYGMRSLKPGGMFLYAVPTYEVTSKLHNFKDGVKICESMYFADNFNLILQGYIYMDRQLNVVCEANDIRGLSLRHSMAYPKYKWYFNDAEERAPRILVNSGVMDLICNNELFDVVVEFTYYDIPVGRNKEPLLIWEVRDY